MKYLRLVISTTRSLECTEATVDIPGLLSVNADIYELGKEAFVSALFSTVYLQYS